MTSIVLQTEDCSKDSQVKDSGNEESALISSSKGDLEWSSATSVDRSDSGMEEESFQSPGSDDDDDGVFTVKKARGRKKMVIDDDEDDEDEKEEAEDENRGINAETQNPSEVFGENNEADNSFSETSNINSQSDNDRSRAEGDKATSDDGSDAENDAGSNLGDKGADEVEKDEGKSKENESDNENNSQGLQYDFKTGDLFDAESSDDDHEADASRNEDDEDHNDSRKGSDDDDSEDNNVGNDDDEGFDESQIDPALLAKLKKFKGASKSQNEREKYKRSSKANAEQKMLEIHSESQRLVRDSRVNLPYYEPQPKSLNDFLARANKKRQEYAGLRHARDIQKAKIICDKLSTTPLPSLPKRRPKITPDTPSIQNANNSPSTHSQAVSALQESQSQTSAPTSESEKIHPSSQPEKVSSDSPVGNPDDSGVASQEMPQSLASTVSLSSSLEPQKMVTDDGLTTENVRGDDDDELPDLEIETVSSGHMSATNCSEREVTENITPSYDGEEIDKGLQENTNSDEQYTNIKDFSENGTLDNKMNNEVSTTSGTGTSKTPTDMAVDCDIFIPSLQKDPSRDLFQSQSTVGDRSETLKLAFSQESILEVNLSQNIESNLEDNTENSQSTATIIEETPHSGIISEVTTPQCSVSETIEAHTEEEAKTPVQTSKSPAGKRLLSKLKGLDLSELPRLSGTPDQVICLDEPQKVSSVPRNPGLEKLFERLDRQTKPRTPRVAHDVNLSIIEKEGEGTEQKLKLKTVTYHVRQEEAVDKDSTPGAKLARLKQQLGVGMRKKREEARQRRLQLYALENEEGFEGAKEEEEEEEYEDEAEMTDGAESEDDEDEEEEEDYELKFDQYGDESDDGKDYNPLLDMEANEDDDSDDEVNENKDDASDNPSDFEEDSNDVHLHFDVSDEEDEEENEEEVEKKGTSSILEDEDDLGLTSLKKKRRSQIVYSDDEDDNEIKSISKSLKKEDSLDSLSLWSNELTPMTRHLQDTQPLGQHRFRRDNSRSPDLYSTGMPEDESSSGQNFEHLNDSSQSVGYFNTQSQMLDADGFLKLTQTQRPPKSRISALAQSPIKGNSGSMNFESSLRMTAGNIFNGEASQAFTGDVRHDEDENMKELMGLCSGTFGPKWGDGEDDDNSLPSSQSRIKTTQEFKVHKSSDSEDSNVYDPFHVLSDVEDDDQSTKKHKRIKPVLSDSEDEENENQDDDEDVDRDADTDAEDDAAAPVKFSGFKDKKKGIRREFVDEEAELSGSEYDSDENLDLAEEDDILEEEEGDKDMAGVSVEKLRDEVGRVHMKQLQDDDDREVMRFKEMYLQDGDLYTEGGGRMRNFRWKDMDQDSQQDMFGQQSDDEQAEEEPEETHWRKDRFEREKFIDEADNNLKDENSQILRLGQLFLKKKESNIPQPQGPAKSKPAMPEPHKPQPQKKGSFLSRSKEVLAKIAQVAKSSLTGGSTKASKNFIFQTKDSAETQDENNTKPQPMKPPKRKAHSIGHTEQEAKKPKLSHTTPSPARPLVRRQSSIFNLLEEKSA